MAGTTGQVTLACALALAACGESKRSPGAALESSAADARVTPAREVAPATELAPVVAAEPGAVPAQKRGLKAKEIDFSRDKRPPEGDMVFFAALDELLVPLGCYKAETKELAGGAACLGRAPAQAEVFVTNHEIADIGALGAARAAACEGLTTAPQGYELEGAAQVFDWGTWPKSGTFMVVQTLPEDQGPHNQAPTAEQLKLVRMLLKGAGAANRGDIAVQQHMIVDLDGDPEQEQVWSLTVRKSPEAPVFQWSGLIVVDETGAGSTRVVESSRDDGSVYVMRGMVDLAGTGRKLMWTRRVEGTRVADRLVAIEGDEIRYLSEWTCSP